VPSVEWSLEPGESRAREAANGMKGAESYTRTCKTTTTGAQKVRRA